MREVGYIVMHLLASLAIRAENRVQKTALGIATSAGCICPFQSPLCIATIAAKMISQRSGVVLLLGAPGVGKSLAGRLLKHAHSASVHAFVNVGQLLRATGMVEQHLRNPTSASKAALGAAAREILSGACCEFKAACAANNKWVV